MSRVNHKGLHQGWSQASLYLQVIHFTSHFTTIVFLFFLPIYIAQALNTGTYIQQCDLFYSGGPTQEPVSATSNTGKKSGEVLEKIHVNGPEGQK